MTDSPGKLRIGISGWRYPGWRGVFYPPGLPQRSELAFAASRMNTAEINGSFYSLQRPSSWQAWHAQTPADFVFAVKAPRYITHMLKLAHARVPLANFLASGVLGLDAKLGPLLWQLPPNLGFDAGRMEAFLALLPRDTDAARALAVEHDARLQGRVWLPALPRRALRHAVEVRHASFVDPAFIALLRRHRVALVVADTAARWPLIEDVTAGFVYVRLHGDQALYTSGYGDPALSRWAARIAAWRAGTQVEDARTASPIAPRAARRRDVYCYFDNDVKVHAPFDAMRLAGLAAAPADARKASPTERPARMRATRK
jgi:uncharacterized protein YecE (DUF72 family)